MRSVHRSVAQPGRAPRSGRGGRRFKSCHSDQLHHQGADRSQLSAKARHLESGRVHRPVHKRVLRMVSLRQDSRGNFFARKRLPDDVREEYGRLYGARFEAKFFVRASVGKQVAQQKFREWANEVEQRIEAIRKALRGEGIDLDREQATALAGEWYLWFVSNYEKEDADPEAYEAALWDIIEAMREFAPDEVREQPLRDMRWARDTSRRDHAASRFRRGAHRGCLDRPFDAGGWHHEEWNCPSGTTSPTSGRARFSPVRSGSRFWPIVLSSTQSRRKRG